MEFGEDLSENDLRKEVLSKLRIDPRIKIIWRNDGDRVRSRKTRSKDRIGLPDLQGYRSDGEAFNLELKRPDGSGRIRPEQADFIEACCEIGVRAGVARSYAECLGIIFGEKPIKKAPPKRLQ